MSMGKRRRVGGAEEDAFCKWCRKYMIWLHQSGVRSKIKTNVRRRERHEAKQQLRMSRSTSED